MTHAEALSHLRSMMLGVQKARSISVENMPDVRDDMHEMLGGKWLFGRTNILPKVIEAVERAEKGEPIVGLDFHNMMVVAIRLQPSIAMCAINYQTDPLPDPDITWAGQVWEAS